MLTIQFERKAAIRNITHRKEVCAPETQQQGS